MSSQLVDDVAAAVAHLESMSLAGLQPVEPQRGRAAWEAYVTEGDFGTDDWSLLREQELAGYAAKIHFWEEERDFGLSLWGGPRDELLLDLVYPHVLRERDVLALEMELVPEEWVFGLTYGSFAEAASLREYVLALLLGSALESAMFS